MPIALRFPLLALALALPACAEKTANRCPGTPEPRCVTGVVCDMDQARGCQVCRCATPLFTPAQQLPATGPVSTPP